MQAPTVLLIESAHLWLGRSGKLGAVALHQFLPSATAFLPLLC